MRAARRYLGRPTAPFKRTRPTGSRRNRAAILFDALIATGILGMGAFAVCSFVPTVYHGQAYGYQETKAAHMGSKMAENLQMLVASNITCKTLTDLKLIDAGQANQPYSFTHIPLDDGACYSPATALPKGTGTLTFTNLAGGAVKAKIVISWTSPYGVRSWTTGTIIGGYR